ncbi:hypothetical protein IFM89_012383 [Coptis chinensis]|uniref:Uncharacterized protein n=1 Tax=Coptis chinensis TaxID=261450 RepID=A0A835LMT7_9MAGN|nr:hypothetical protein IFM89_012383 [Coptis chinensis]
MGTVETPLTKRDQFVLVVPNRFVFVFVLDLNLQYTIIILPLRNNEKILDFEPSQGFGEKKKAGVNTTDSFVNDVVDEKNGKNCVADSSLIWWRIDPVVDKERRALGNDCQELENLLEVFESMVVDQRRCKDESLGKISSVTKILALLADLIVSSRLGALDTQIYSKSHQM